MVPEIRLLTKNEAAVRGDGEYVLYWMIATRRARWNFALDRAVEWAPELGKPLLVLEALRCDYRWASDRVHRFVLDGMRDNATASAGLGSRLLPVCRARRGSGQGPPRALAAACRGRRDRRVSLLLPAAAWWRRRPAGSTSSSRRSTRTVCCPWRRPIAPSSAPSTSAASCRGSCRITSRTFHGEASARAALLSPFKGVVEPSASAGRGLGAAPRSVRAWNEPADRPRGGAGGGERRLRGRRSGALRPLPRRAAGSLRCGAQPPGCRRRQRAVGLPAFRPHLRTPDPRRRRSKREDWSPWKLSDETRRQAARLVEPGRVGGVVSSTSS